MMDVAEQYLDELAARGMVEVHEVEFPSIRWFRSCSLHDLIWDLFLHKVKEEHLWEVIYSDCIDESSKFPKSIGKTRKFFVHINSRFDREGFSSRLKKDLFVRSLLFLKSHQDWENFVEFWEPIDNKQFRLLKVLHFDSFDLRGSKFLGKNRGIVISEVPKLHGLLLGEATIIFG
ncbi:hypothetical protein ACH5RR_024306 [Cinchona calisaya]|uniref:Uncharacterized protein n=1 Tax=Cinchona calisaya TaxID=153742 RepID=A0ABD2YW92_9GENT